MKYNDFGLYLIVVVACIGLATAACTAKSESGPSDVADPVAVTDSSHAADTEESDTEGDAIATGDTDDASEDIDSGGEVDSSLACSGPEYPEIDCPCDVELGHQECCEGAGYGLSCDPFFGTWSRFHDCGCSTLPDCEGWPLYSLCPQPPHF